MKKIAAFFGIATTLFFPLSASATNYDYNNYVGKVYVKNVTVENIGNGMRYTINIHTPSCPNQYHVEGYVQLTYRSNNGGWFRTESHRFTGSDEENVDRTFANIVNYNMSDRGKTNIVTNAECKYHGIRHGGIRLPF